MAVLAAAATIAVPLAASADAASMPRTGTFEGGNLAEWDIAPNVTPSTSKVTVDRSGPCSGSYSATASIPGDGSNNQFARTIWGNSSGTSSSLNLGENTDFWYSTSLFLPAGFTAAMQSYYVPMRWDNFGVSNVTRSGLAMYSDGSFRLMAEQDKVVPQYNLLGSTSFRLSEGVWHSIEVHQKLNGSNGAALNELYVDGKAVGTSTTRNYFGQPVSAIRYGIVAIAQGQQTRPLTVKYDNAYLGATRNTAAACGSAAAPQPSTAPSASPAAPAPAPSPSASPSSTAASSDTQPPTAAGGLRVVGRTPSAASLAWNAAQDNVGVSRYEIWRGDAAWGNWTSVGSVSGSTLTYSDTTAGSASRTYAIRAYDAAGNKSASSNSVSSSPVTPTASSAASDTTAPSPAPNVRVVANSVGAVTVGWDKAADDSGVVRYELWRGDASYSNWVIVGKVTGDVLQARDGTVASGKSYAYAVRAFDQAGNKSASSKTIQVRAS